YPQEETHQLLEKLSDYADVPRDRIMIGNGSDELIERVMQVFVEKGDQTLSISPTFSMYKHIAGLLGSEYVEAPLKRDFALDTERILRSLTPRTKILILCSPNNPTGNQLDMADIESLLEEFQGPVIVDEAYVEFADYSVAQLLREFDNLVILRTFSKAFGLAGLRLGYGLASQELSATLSEKIQPPYPVGSMTLRMGAKLLDNAPLINATVEELKVEREILIKELNQVAGVTAFDSQTNFVLFRTSRQLDEVYQELVNRGVLVKKLGRVLHLDNCFRTTVGLPGMNRRLIDALRE
ncbi:MAG: histidinol-phosphate transaminase, partial [archaeon]